MNKNIIVGLIAGTLSLGVVIPANAATVAHWGFDETGGTTAFDSVGGVNGALVGGIDFVPTGGIKGGAIQVTNGYVDMGDNFAATSAFSIEAWIKIAAGDTSPMTPVSKHWSTIGQGYYLATNNVFDGYTQDNVASFRSIGGDPSPTAVGGALVNNGLWHQLVGVFDNGITSIFVDGVLDGSGSGGFSDNTAHFLVGGLTWSDGTPTNWFSGMIDEVSVYNSALTASEVSTLYNNTMSAVPTPPTLVLFGSGLAVWSVQRLRENLHSRAS